METITGGGSPIKVLIAVLVKLYREGLATMLNAQEHLRIQGTVGTPLEVRTAVRRLQPDVVIVDISFESALNVMREIRVESSTSRILAFAVREDLSAILEYAQAGADGFVTANGSVSELVEAIERTAAGELLCSPKIAAQLLRRAAQTHRPAEHAAGPNLTIREQQVISLVRQGQSNKEIGAALKISEATVKNHVHNVLQKLQVSTRGRAAATFSPPAA